MAAVETQEMWRFCANWLLQLEVIPKNHRVMTSDATFQDLAYTLRDGVLLCHIASTIDENSISPRSINHRPQMAQFLCLQNIRLFLTACKTSFGLKDADLFEPSHLYDFSDFAIVLQTLSVLSNSSKVKAARPDIPSWSWSLHNVGNGNTDENNLEEPSNEEVIYKQLETEADEGTYQEFYYKHHGGSNYGYVWGKQNGEGQENSSNQNGTARRGESTNSHRNRNYAYLPYYADEEKEEEIYADLGLVRRGPNHDHNRSVHSAAARLSDWRFEPKEKRDFVLVELLETEANYVDVLNRLRKNFIRPITTICESDKKIIFMNIKELGDIHTAFFTALFNYVKENKGVGDVFVKFKEKFLKYADYCSGLTKAQITLENLCAENKEVEKEIERCENSANSKRILLRDMLAVPMQRILKYHLLLQVMVKATPDQHEDYRSFVQAHEAMIDVASYINEAKRDSELLHNINVIEKSISALTMPDNTSLKDYGRLKKDGEVKVQSHELGNGTKHRQRYIFLFDKLILMSKTNSNDTYKLKELLRVADYNVQEISSSKDGNGSGLSITGNDVVRAAGRRVMRRDSSRWSHAFLLVHVERTNVYTIFARTLEEKAKWMEAFKEAFRNAHLDDVHGGHDLHLSTYDKPTTCDVCFLLLKGLFYQGYKCSKCSRSVHEPCITRLTSSCGPLLEPPALPPRPSSMQLPTILQNGNDSIDDGKDSADELQDPIILNRCTSNSSLVLAPSLPPTASAASATYSSLTAHPDYINTRMEDHSWYVGQMDRPSAEVRLFPYPPGAFLVRGGRLGYALSLKTDIDVKHMKIDTQDSTTTTPTEDSGAAVADPEVASAAAAAAGGRRYYFSENRKFNSIVELVSWYCRNSLKESFQGLDTRLQFPIGELSLVEAIYDFNPASGEDRANLMTLKTGERVAVIDKLDDKGWWKAHDGKCKIGYIPKTFVIEV